MLEENLADPDARHLMLVCSGEVHVALTLLQSAASKQEKNLQIMMGSTFSEDQSDTWHMATSSGCGWSMILKRSALLLSY